MDQVARKPVIKQGRAHFPSLHLDRTLNIEITKRTLLDTMSRLESEFSLSRSEECGHPSVTLSRCLLAPIYQATGHQRWVWPGGDRGETEVMMMWRGNGPTPPGHLAFRGDLYWKHFSWIYLLLIDNEGHICKECVVIQRWSICEWRPKNTARVVC